MSKAQQILDHWERHGKFQQTEADKAFGEPIEVLMARELLMLRHSCRMAIDFIEDGKSALAAMSIRATLDVLDKSKAAAERLASAVERLRNGDEIYHQTFQAEADEGTVSREYLRLTDPTPITPELLKRLGFFRMEIDNEFVWHFSAIDLRCWDGDWRIQMSSGMWEHIPNPTLGAIRCIAFGMGITLAEQPNG